jgi:hypothetical protein
MKNEINRTSYYKPKAMKKFYKKFHTESNKKEFVLNSNNLLTVSEMISIRGGVEAPAPPPILR